MQNFDDEIIKENLKIDWNGYVSNPDESGGEVREYAAELPNDMVIIQGDRELHTRYSVLATKNNGSGKWEYVLLKYVVEEQDLLQNVSYFTKGNFTGTVYALNLEGNTLNVNVFEDGEQMAMIKSRKKGALSLTSREDVFCQGYWCNNGGGSGGSGGRWLNLTTTTYTMYFNVHGDGTFTYNGFKLESSHTKSTFVPNSAGYGDGNTAHQQRYIAGGHVPSGVKAPPVDIVIDQQFMNDFPCQTSIITQANIDDNKVADAMKKAFGESSNTEYDVVYRNANILQIDGTVLAQTVPKVDSSDRINNITISFDNQYLKEGTDLSIYATTIHENVHAIMMYQLDKMDITINDSNVDFSILADEWSKAVANKQANGNVGSAALAHQMHEIMSSWVQDMASILSDYASGQGYDLSELEAEAIAWTGLQESVAWTVMDEESKELFENLIDYEATGFEVLANGTKCN